MSPKLIKKLADKKYRIETGLFIVEGEKSIKELLGSDLIVEEIHGTNMFLDLLGEDTRTYEKRSGQSIALTGMHEEDLVKIGTLQTNNAGIAVVRQKKEEPIEKFVTEAKTNFVLALSDVRDPGNFGTIIRIADWFGVTHIVASETTTDFYNPKTVAASMGSFTRVSVAYLQLADFLNTIRKSDTSILAADMRGKNIHDGGLPTNGVLIMGSESHGIENSLVPFVTEKITIPRYGGAESLNVSVATGVILDALRRSQKTKTP
jgi:TrmH family RNA methyltransferase